MATRELVHTLIVEAAGIIKRQYTETEIGAAVDMFCRQFDALSNEDLTDGFDWWMERLPEDKPPLQWPAVKAIQRCVKEAQRAKLQSDQESSSSGPASGAGSIRPRPSFVKSHMGFMRRMLAGMDGVLQQHDHHTKRQPVTDDSGDVVTDDAGHPVFEVIEAPDGCPVCGPAGEERSARRQQFLLDLPQPHPAFLPTMPCKCDGTRFVESKSDPDRWYPCATCNFGAFDSWKNNKMGQYQNEGVVTYG